MSLNDPLANALSHIMNSEAKGKSVCIIRNSSKLIKQVLNIMKEHRYIGEFKEIKTEQGSMLELNLIGAINNCNVIKPKYSVKQKDFEKFEKRFLPAKDFGIIILSTPKGLMTHLEAMKKNIGGRLISYVY